MLHRGMLAGVFVLAAVSAAAQPAEGERTQSVGGGAEWVYPARGGPISGTPGVNVSWQRWFGDHVGVETAFGWWHKRLVNEFSSPQFVAPDGRVYPAVHGVYRSTFDSYSLGFNLLGRLALGERAAIVAGGGPGLFIDRGRFESRTNLSEHTGSDANGDFGIQMVAELQVRAADHLLVVGGVRADMRRADYDAAAAYPTLGVRWLF